MIYQAVSIRQSEVKKKANSGWAMWISKLFSKNQTDLDN